MKKTLFASTILGVMALASIANAQSYPWDLNQPLVGKDANTFMIRLRAIGVIPLNSSSYGIGDRRQRQRDGPGRA